MNQVATGQFASGHACVGKQSACAAFNVNPRVNACGAGMRRDGIQLFFAFSQILGQRTQGCCTLLEVHGQHPLKTRCSAVLKGLRKVETFGMGKGHFFAIDGAVQCLCCLLTDPTAGDKTLENVGHMWCALWRWKKRRNMQLKSTSTINQPHGLEILCMFPRF